jgi:hypothetical protein
MKQVCLSRQYFLLPDFTGFRGPPRSRGAHYTDDPKAVKEKCSSYFQPLRPAVFSPRSAPAAELRARLCGPGRAAGTGWPGGARPYRPALGAETFRTSQ